MPGGRGGAAVPALLTFVCVAVRGKHGGGGKGAHALLVCMGAGRVCHAPKPRPPAVPALHGARATELAPGLSPLAVLPQAYKHYTTMHPHPYFPPRTLPPQAYKHYTKYASQALKAANLPKNMKNMKGDMNMNPRHMKESLAKMTQVGQRVVGREGWVGEGVAAGR